MENVNTYKFVGKIALEFRLSLKNVCKLLGKEPNEKNKMNIYQIIKELNITTYEELNYLFFYETVNEPENISKITYSRAVNYVKRYNKAKKDGNKEEVIKILGELVKTEKDFEEVRKREYGKEYTKEEIDIISRYRIKHVMSRERCCNWFGFGESTIGVKEKQTDDNVLKIKIETLNERFKDIENQRRRNK